MPLGTVEVLLHNDAAELIGVAQATRASIFATYAGSTSTR